ncbi:MAG: hypothetical protein Q7V63_07385 [Gammaproteobacteria bacterium]|nr:hypothetical protein [Gammaproteobacteria bacterium]
MHGLDEGLTSVICYDGKLFPVDIAAPRIIGTVSASDDERKKLLARMDVSIERYNFDECMTNWHQDILILHIVARYYAQSTVESSKTNYFYEANICPIALLQYVLCYLERLDHYIKAYTDRYKIEEIRLARSMFALIFAEQDFKAWPSNEAIKGVELSCKTRVNMKFAPEGSEHALENFMKYYTVTPETDREGLKAFLERRYSTYFPLVEYETDAEPTKEVVPDIEAPRGRGGSPFGGAFYVDKQSALYTKAIKDSPVSVEAAS